MGVADLESRASKSRCRLEKKSASRSSRQGRKGWGQRLTVAFAFPIPTCASDEGTRFEFGLRLEWLTCTFRTWLDHSMAIAAARRA